MLCNDPEVPVEYHGEDYGEPYLWCPPAVYSLCRHCHRDKLHKRFWRHSAWITYLAHVRRGGYARDLKIPELRREILMYQKALERGETPTLAQLRPYAGAPGTEWFARLSLDEGDLTNPASRPRG